MAQDLDRGQPDRQASWVALKTLRQRPTVAGQTDEGATIYEVRSVELVLPPGAAHFKRLVSCAKCRRRVPGAFVLGPADLDHPAQPVFCDRCAQSSSRPGPAQVAEVSPGLPAPAAAPAVEAESMQRLSQQVADLLRAQHAQLSILSASVAEVRAELRELGESNQALALAQRDLDQRMVSGVHDLRSEIASLQRRVDESAARSEPGAVGAGELAELRATVAATIDNFGRRLVSLQQKAEEGERQIEALTASADAGVSRQHALEQLIDATARQLARLIELQTQTAPPAPGGGSRPGGIMESLERQLRAAELRLLQTTNDAGGE